MFKVNNKDTRTTSTMSHCNVSIADFEQVLVYWVLWKNLEKLVKE